MDKRKWPWKRRSSEKSPDENESPGSVASSQSERCSDNQEAVKGSQNHKLQYPEVTSGHTDCAIICKENGKSHSLMHKLSETRNDNGLPEYGTGKDYGSDQLRDGATLTASVVSNGSYPDQDPASVEVVSLSENDGGSLNQEDPGPWGAAVSIGSSKAVCLISVPELEKDTSVVTPHQSLNVDCQSVEASFRRGEAKDGVKLLEEKLVAALVNLRLKDEQVKQHSTVAEEAVAGWEKTEKEVADLMRQLEAMAQQKIAMEARVSHQDEALKECVRQLRLTKEEQEQKVGQAVAERTHDIDLIKSKLEAQLFEMQAQLEAAAYLKRNSVDADLLGKLEYLEEENIALKQELLSQSEELQVATIERDLSTKAAETSSKQHLESIKKMAKLESECRRLNTILTRKPLANASDHSTLATTSNSSCVESVTTDSQSDNGDSLNASEFTSQKSDKNGLWANALTTELHHFKNRNASFSINGLAALPISSSVEIDLMDDFLEMERFASLSQTGPHLHEPEFTSNVENQSRKELGLIESRMHVLEKRVEKVETEKSELEAALAQSQACLDRSQTDLIESRMKLEQLEAELQETSVLKKDLESNVSNLELEAQAMASKMKLLYEEIDGLRIFSEELSAKCSEWGKDLARKEEELKLERQSIPSKDELERKNMALAESLQCSEASQLKTRMKLDQLEMELKKANGSNQQLESELKNTREEGGRLLVHVNSLQAVIDKEQATINELSARCRSYENVLQKEQKLEQLQNAHCNNDKKIKQEDLAAAASGKLSECQKTIASLGNQLKSLATLEDFLIDTTSIPGFPGSNSPLVAKGASGTTWKFHSNNVSLPK